MSNAIILKGNGIRKERIANAAITPGMLVELMSTNKVRKHASAGAYAQSAYAVENEVVGDDIDVDYAAADNVLYNVMERGAEINALVAAAAAALVIGDKLESAGDGTLRKLTAGADADGLYDIGTLAISATADQFKTTTTAIFKIGGAQYSKVATDNLEFTAADTVNAAAGAGIKYGIWRVQIDAAGTISTKPGGGLADQVYTTAALALAALPAVDANNVSLGYITVASPTSTAFTCNTTALTTIGAFVDETTLDAFSAFLPIAVALEAVDNSAGGAVARIKVEVL